MSKKYLVEVREVWVQMVEIEAEYENEAIQKVSQGQGEQLEGCFEYSHTLDPEYWTINRGDL